MPDASRLQKLIELYLVKGVFLTGLERAEAQKLWNLVKQMFDARAEKSRFYPIFDTGWFNALLAQNQAKVNSQKALTTFDFGVPLKGNLPLQPTSFVGRQQALVEVTRLLKAGPLLTLSGAGGIGKTRLALEVAGQMKEEFEEGVWLVELASQTTLQGVVQSVAGTLGVKEVARQALVSTLVEYLKPKNLLLVLDNCEHLVKPCATFVTQLVQNCPHLKILVTSRQRLGIAGEINWKVPALSFPDSSQLSPEKSLSPTQLSHYEAVQLLLERANSVQPGFSLSEQNAAAVARLCYHLDGIPLAIELAAARLRVLTVEQISELLAERFRLLSTGNRTALPRQQTLRALIDWSYQLLEEAEQSLLARLSIFGEGFSLEGVEAICAGEGLEKPQVLTLLEGLVLKSLVLAERQGTAMRYRMLETIRQYGWEKLKEPGEKERWQDNHLDYYLGLAIPLQTAYSEGKQKEGLKLFEREYPNLKLALTRAIESKEAEKALRLCDSLGEFWAERGYFSEGRNFLECSLALSDSFNSSNRARVLGMLAKFAERQGDYQLGKNYAWQSLELAQHLNKKTVVAESLRALGIIFYHQGEYKAAHDYYNQALKLYREEGDEPSIANCLHDLALLAKDQSNYRDARGFHEEALVLYCGSGNKLKTATTYLSLGSIAFQQGDYETADSYLQESLKLANEFGSLTILASTLTNLGMVAGGQEKYSSAEDYTQRALALHRQTGNKLSTGNTLGNLGKIALIRGHYEKAFNYIQEALTIERQLNYKHGAATCLRNLGEIALNQGDFRAAHDFLQESMILRQELNNKKGVASCLYGLGNLAVLQRQYKLAEDYYLRSLQLRREIQDKAGLADGLKNLGLLASIQKEYNEAVSYFRESLVEGKNLNSKLFTAEALAALLSGLVGESEQAQELAKLAGTVEGLLSTSGAALGLIYLGYYSTAVKKLKERLGLPAFEAAAAEGRLFTLIEALELALALLTPGS